MQNESPFFCDYFFLCGLLRIRRFLNAMVECCLKRTNWVKSMGSDVWQHTGIVAEGTQEAMRFLSSYFKVLWTPHTTSLI